MYNIFAFIALLLSCYFLLLNIRLKRPAENILAFFCLFTAQIVASGYVLSCLNWLGDVRYWLLLGLVATALSAIHAVWNRQSIALPRFKFTFLTQTIVIIKDGYTKKLSFFERLLLTPLILTTLVLGVLNLILVIFAAPHNWDSMTYHLARVAYYLQNNNLGYFGANYWAQVVQPKNSSLLLLYTYLISGRNENLTQLVQYFSYWVSICAVYAIARSVGNSKAHSIFAATVSALLTEWLMQATTTQNDLVLTAYFGATVYFLLAFRKVQDWKYLVLAALGMGLSIGTKASSFLPLASVAVVGFYALFKSRVTLLFGLRNSAILVLSTTAAVCIFALPAGYMENYRNYGNPIGPQDVRKLHCFEGKSLEYIARNGTNNLMRFGIEFLSLDGMPPISSVCKLQTLIRFPPETLMHWLELDLETTEATRAPFDLHKPPIAHEDASYWGILGFGLIWVVVMLSIVGVIKPTDIRILSLGAVLFLFVQAYAGPYDPWRGRYFTTAAIFAVPTIGVCLQTKNQLIRAYLLLITLIGSISAISAVVVRMNNALVSIRDQEDMRTNILALDRMTELTRNRPVYNEPLRKFDQLVPTDATVAVFLLEDSFEYPLFGEDLTRTIIPINSFDKGLQPVPIDAKYLLYTQSFPCADIQEDVYLGADWYLRSLGDRNRTCP